MNTLVVVSKFSTIFISFVLTVCFSNACLLSFAEMEAARQRMRAAATRKKEEERKAKGKEGASSSASKAVSKGLAKRKGDGKDDHPSKKATITLGDAPHKKKSPPKPSGDVGKGLMTSTGPVIEGSCRLLTHKDYAVKEVKSLIKSTDVEPCAELGMKKLGALALFYLTQVSLLSWLIWFPFFPFID